MDIEKLIEKTESYHQLRSEIISEIQQIVRQKYPEEEYTNE